MEVVLNQFIGYDLKAPDGRIGKVVDFYFHESSWTIQYLVVDTGKWLNHEILISPSVLLEPDIFTKTFPVRTTRSKVESQSAHNFRRSCLRYSPFRRTQVITGHVIKAPEAVLGKVSDFILEDNTWQIRYLVIKIERSLLGKILLLDSRHLANVGWSSNVLELNL